MYRSKWDLGEASKALEMRRKGFAIKEIAEALGRTPDGVTQALTRFFGTSEKVRHETGEPIALTDDDIAAAKDGKIGSEVLRIACLDLFQRTASRYSIRLEDAMACHLGFYEPPSIVRAPFKTASAQRGLAA